MTTPDTLAECQQECERLKGEVERLDQRNTARLDEVVRGHRAAVVRGQLAAMEAARLRVALERARVTFDVMLGPDLPRVRVPDVRGAARQARDRIDAVLARREP